MAILALVQRFPDLALADPAADAEWRPMSFFRGLRALPVRARGGGLAFRLQS